jgi:hypothetical protein
MERQTIRGEQPSRGFPCARTVESRTPAQPQEAWVQLAYAYRALLRGDRRLIGAGGRTVVELLGTCDGAIDLRGAA